MDMYIVHMNNLEIAEKLAEKVSLAIVNSGKSKLALSQETGIPYATLHRKLRGYSEFSLSEILRISEATATTPARLIPDIFQS